MTELRELHTTDSAWGEPEIRGDEDVPDHVDLTLTVTDPEVCRELAAYPDGRMRRRFAANALRIGVLALKQAEGRLDAEVIQNEGERLIASLENQLTAHREAVTEKISASIKEYFDPGSGRFNERLERLLKEDGELEQVLRRQVGGGESELARTLSSHFGETSPLMKILSPQGSESILSAIEVAVGSSLEAGREGILKEFSLDNKQSALSRLVQQLTEKNGEVTADLQGSIRSMAGEFSLDDESSALSRLMRHVRSAQEQISSEFSLDSEQSALARMRRELLDVLESHKQDSSRFQVEVREALAGMQARKQAAHRTTTHGNEFEHELLAVLQDLSRNSGSIVSHCGNTTGVIRHCKVGDILVEVGPEHRASGARIVIEAKQKDGVDLPAARAEIETARKNRNADVGIFVFSKKTAPEGLDAMERHGSDLFVVWDSEDAASDVYLHAALTVALALSVQKVSHRESRKADLDVINYSIREIEKQMVGIGEIGKWASTIKSNSEKILGRADKMETKLLKEIENLDEHLADIKKIIEEEKDS